MTQEQKDKIEQAVKAYIDSWPVKFTAAESSAFLAGAQTILDNPGKWGIKEVSQSWFTVLDALTKHREALERIIHDKDVITANDMIAVAEEALKQQDDEKPI